MPAPADKSSEESGLQPSDPRLWVTPAPLASGHSGLPPAVLPDLLCLAEFFAAFHEQISVPQLTVDDLAAILSSPGRLELAETVCSAMTKHIVMLSQSAPMPCGPTYFKYEREHFFGIRAEQLVDLCLDGVTWEAVLHAYTSEHVPVLNVNLEMRNAVARMYDHGFFSLGMRQRLQVLMYLTNEMLGTAHCREVMSTNLLETELLDTANREEKERRAKEEQEWAKEKAKRAPTAYNLYLQSEMIKCKQLDPTMLSKDAFAQSAANWKALGNDQVKRWTKRAKLQSDEDKMDATQKEVLATLESIVQKIVDSNNDQVQQQHQQILDNLSVRTVSLGTDRFYNRYWVMPAFPDKLWVEDCSVLTASFRPPAVAAFLETKGRVSTKVAAAQNRVAELLDSAAAPVLRKAGKMLGLSFSESEQKTAIIKEVMANDADGEVVGELLQQLGDHKTRHYARTLLSLEELEEWELVFPEKGTKSSSSSVLSKQPSVKTEAELIAEETDGTVGERRALSQQLADSVSGRPGAVDRLAAEFYQRGMPEARLELPVAKPAGAAASGSATGTKRGAGSANRTVDIEISVAGALGLKFEQSLTIELVDNEGIGYRNGIRAGMKLVRFQGSPVQDFGSTMAKLVATPRPWRFTFQLPDTSQSNPAAAPAAIGTANLATSGSTGKDLNHRSHTVAPASAGGDDRDESVEGEKAIAPRSVVPAQSVRASTAAAAVSNEVAAVAPDAATAAPGSASAQTTAGGADNHTAVQVADAATEAAVSEPRQRQPRQRKAPPVSLPAEITVRLEAAYQSYKAAETKARAAAERERSQQAGGTAAPLDSLRSDRVRHAGPCKACLGSHRAHTCGKRKTLAPDEVVKKPKIEPLAEIPNYSEDEELEKMVEEQSRETGVDAGKVRQWYEQRMRTTARRKGGGGRTRSRAEQINELKSRSDPNWVPVGNSKPKAQRAPSDAGKTKQTAEADASSSWNWDLNLPPLIPPELENLPLQPAGAVGYWEETTVPSVHIVKNARWRCYDDPGDVDALLACVLRTVYYSFANFDPKANPQKDN